MPSLPSPFLILEELMDTGEVIISVVWTSAHGEVRSTHIKVIRPNLKTADEVINKVLNEVEEISNEYW